MQGKEDQTLNLEELSVCGILRDCSVRLKELFSLMDIIVKLTINRIQHLFHTTEVKNGIDLTHPSLSLFLFFSISHNEAEVLTLQLSDALECLQKMLKYQR